MQKDLRELIDELKENQKFKAELPLLVKELIYWFHKIGKLFNFLLDLDPKHIAKPGFLLRRYL